MKRLLVNVWLVCLFTTTYSYAGSSTWKLDPTSDDWNTAANWVDDTVPNGPNDGASFDLSNLTNVVVSQGTELRSIFFNPTASAYTITCPPGQMVSVSELGMVNDSGLVQNFAATADESGSGGLFFFENASSAGVSTVFTNYGSVLSGGDGGFTQFIFQADAGSATLVNNGGVVDGAKGGEVDFFNSTSANRAIITNKAGLASGSAGGATFIEFQASAANATVMAEGATVSGAGGGSTIFQVSAHAAAATLIAQGGSNGGGGGLISFQNKTNGGTSRIEVFGNGTFEIDQLNTTGVTLGSLEGDGQVVLGSKALTVGANNLSTTFSGVIQDTGSLTKLGNGTLTLSGANTYTGTTTVTAGALRVSNRSVSATGTGAVKVEAGTLGGGGIVAGAVTIGTGSGTGAFLAPGVGASKPTTLTLQSLLTFKADGTYTYKLNTNKAKADQVLANGVTIETGAQFDFNAVANKKLTAGQVFTAIGNTSETPISGTFANLADGSTFTAGRNNYQVSYSAGDGNDLTLTVVP